MTWAAEKRGWVAASEDIVTALEGRLRGVQVNDILAVSVAGAVVVVIATILGAVELLRKTVAAIVGR